MTAEEFERQYAEQAGITVDQLRGLGRVVRPCSCDYPECQGWQSISKERAEELDRGIGLMTRDRYFLTCECGTAEEVGTPSGKCEGCGKPYSGLVPFEKDENVSQLLAAADQCQRRVLKAEWTGSESYRYYCMALDCGHNMHASDLRSSEVLCLDCLKAKLK